MCDSVKTEQVNSGNAQTVAQHYNQLQESGLAERTRSRIFYLRNFNNWIKSVLIADTLGKIKAFNPQKRISVLDLGSGKGGDLLKWKKGKICSLVCADIAATSVQQCEERHRQNKQRERHGIYDAEFITADCTRERLKDKYKKPDQKFDLVSCQFAFHYCFESYQQALMMMRNACECLEVGGYFIGTTPNSFEIVRRLRSSPDNSFGNDVYKISFNQENKEKFPVFGTQYNFHLEGVVDCPEFLVYLPVIEKLAAHYGMKLVMKQTFADYFKKQYQENTSLLGNMQALEPYPPWDEAASASSKPQDYAFAKEFYESLASENHSNRPKKIGTLSLDEWEAATLYLVFVFEKVKDITPPQP